MIKKIIGIAGKARTGKDTCAKYLWAKYGFTRIAFADPMKLAAQHVFGLTNEQTWDDDLKEVVIPYWGLSPRQMFQMLGNEAIKPVFGERHWVKRWNLTYGMVEDTDDIIIPDVRFDFEANGIRHIGGVIIHLTRDAAPSVNAHVSEAGIPFVQGDIRIANNGTIEQLTFQLDAVIEGMEMRGG